MRIFYPSAGEGMILNPAELQALTGKSQRAQKRYDAQAKVLRALGISFVPRPDKTLIVFRDHIHAPTARQAANEEVSTSFVCL